MNSFKIEIHIRYPGNILKALEKFLESFLDLLSMANLEVTGMVHLEE